MNTKSRPSSPSVGAVLRPGDGTSDLSPNIARRVSSDEIFGKQQEIEIEHNGALYRLRKTSLGKLILTK